MQAWLDRQSVITTEPSAFGAYPLGSGWPASTFSPQSSSTEGNSFVMPRLTWQQQAPVGTQPQQRYFRDEHGVYTLDQWGNHCYDGGRIKIGPNANFHGRISGDGQTRIGTVEIK